MAELTDEQVRAIEWCLTLPASLAEATDFQAEEAIKLDMSIKLPDFYSLWEWIYKTSNQWDLWSCTSMWTSHATQILNVKKKWTKPTVNNIITPDWKDLWSKMWHSTTVYDGWDYVERAVDIALKQWIKAKENWKEVSFDWYATQDWTKDDAWLELMKRYIYNWNPIVWCVRWNQKMWNEMSAWEIKTVPTSTTGWHCIAVVWFDKWGFSSSFHHDKTYPSPSLSGKVPKTAFPTGSASPNDSEWKANVRNNEHKWMTHHLPIFRHTWRTSSASKNQLYLSASP